MCTTPFIVLCHSLSDFDSLLIVTSIVRFCDCCVTLCPFQFAIISMGKRELVALLCLSS